MLTDNTSAAPASSRPASDTETAICYFDSRFMPLADANVSIMTHAFMYGTAVFEGIRAYWNAEQGQLYGLKLQEHFERLANSSHMLFMDLPGSVDEMVSLTVELLRRNGFRQDAYVRPSVYKSTQAIGVRLHNLAQGFYMLAIPMGDYIDTAHGITAQTSSWRRTSDQTIPARGKIVGSYVNSAFVKTEAQLNGYDEAIVLTLDGHVSEGSAENLFMVRDGSLVTPPVTDEILEGITRAGLIELAQRELGMPVVQRTIDRTELYVADELLLCGTGAQVSPVVEVDHHPVAGGRIGPVAYRLPELYFDAVRGNLPALAHWLTPVY